MDGLLPDPLTGLVQGIMNGMQIRSQIQRAQDEHTAMQQAQIQQARNNRIQDITQKMLLGANSREVGPDGTVTEQSQLPGFSLGGLDMPAAPVSYTRKANKSRTVSYKDQDGNTMQRELLTEDEQIARQVREKTALARAGQVDVSSILSRMMPQPQAGGGTVEDTPYGGAPDLSPSAVPAPAPAPQGVYVNPAQVPGIMGDMVRSQNNERTNDTHLKTTAANNDTRQNIADEKNSLAKVSRTLTDNDGNVTVLYSDGSKDELGKVGAAKVPRVGAARKDVLTANAQEIKTRWNEKQQQAVDKMQQQEQALHAQRKTLGDAIAADDGETVPDPLDAKGKGTIKVSPLYRSLWSNRLDALTKQVGGLQQSQTRIITGLGGTQPSAAPKQPVASTAPAPAAPAASIPDSAAKRLKKGVVTTFGNGQRWTIGADGKPQQVQAAGR